MDIKKTLEDLLKVPAVSGFEMGFTSVIRDLMSSNCDEVTVDRFYNVTGIKKGTKPDAKKIMITAHYDEIGFMVKSIDDRGFVKITGIGGIDGKILLAHEVMIHGKKDIFGVIGAKPPHLLSPEDRKKGIKLDELSVDTGMSGEKLKDIVSIGDVVTFKAPLFTLQDGKLSSKSFDNRCGVAALMGIMHELKHKPIESDIYFTATTQEEVGLRGATTAAFNINPDTAIIIDGCHGDMPDCPKDETYGLGKGPAIAVGPNLHRDLTNKMIEKAKELEIPYQIDVEPGDTGTEAWAIQVTRYVIPSLLVSIPLRYMHTTVETVHIADIENTIKLCSKFIESLSMESEVIECC